MALDNKNNLLNLNEAYKFCEEAGWPYSISYFRRLIVNEKQIPYSISNRRGHPWEFDSKDLEQFVERQRQEMREKYSNKPRVIRNVKCSECGTVGQNNLDLKIINFAFGSDTDQE